MHTNPPAMPRPIAFFRRLVLNGVIGGAALVLGACAIFGGGSSDQDAATEGGDQSSVVIKDLPKGLPPDERNARHSPIELRGDR